MLSVNFVFCLVATFSLLSTVNSKVIKKSGKHEDYNYLPETLDDEESSLSFRAAELSAASADAAEDAKRDTLAYSGLGSKGLLGSRRSAFASSSFSSNAKVLAMQTLEFAVVALADGFLKAHKESQEKPKFGLDVFKPFNKQANAALRAASRAAAAAVVARAAAVATSCKDVASKGRANALNECVLEEAFEDSTGPQNKFVPSKRSAKKLPDMVRHKTSRSAKNLDSYKNYPDVDDYVNDNPTGYGTLYYKVNDYDGQVLTREKVFDDY